MIRFLFLCAAGIYLLVALSYLARFAWEWKVLGRVDPIYPVWAVVVFGWPLAFLRELRVVQLHNLGWALWAGVFVAPLLLLASINWMRQRPT